MDTPPEIPAWLKYGTIELPPLPRPSFRECLGNCVANLRQYPRARAGLWSALAVTLGAAVTVSGLHMMRPAAVAAPHVVKATKDESIVVKTVRVVAAPEPAPVAPRAVEPPPFVPPVVNPLPAAPPLTKAQRERADRAIRAERAELQRAERAETRKRKRKAWARRVVQQQKYRDEWRN